MTVFETRGSNGHLDNDDGRVGEAARVAEAELSLSTQTHLTCSPVPATAYEQKTSEQLNWRLFFSFLLFPFLLSFPTPPLDQYWATGGPYNVLQATLGLMWALDNPSLYTSTGGGHESSFISCAKRLIYFSQGIKGHCKNALCSLSNIKRVRRHKRIPAITESEDHYRTSRQRKKKQAVQSEQSDERKSWLEKKNGWRKTAMKRRMWYAHIAEYFQIDLYASGSSVSFFFLTSCVYKPWVREASALKASF